METNRSWSIDDKRYNFQFGCEIGWEIRGRQARPHAQESRATAAFPPSSGMPAPRSPAASTGRLWGVPNCGKGQPEQVMGTGHGASPSRFRKIKIGSAYAE